MFVILINKRVYTIQTFIIFANVYYIYHKSHVW